MNGVSSLERVPEARNAGIQDEQEFVSCVSSEVDTCRQVGVVLDELDSILLLARTASDSWWNGCKWDD